MKPTNIHCYTRPRFETLHVQLYPTKTNAASALHCSLTCAMHPTKIHSYKRFHFERLHVQL